MNYIPNLKQIRRLRLIRISNIDKTFKVDAKIDVEHSSKLFVFPKNTQKPMWNLMNGVKVRAPKTVLKVHSQRSEKEISRKKDMKSTKLQYDS